MLGLALALLHPAFAPGQINRYAKLTCMEGRLRVAYTILYGDLPAQAARQRMDVDHDGQITDVEARAFAAAVAATAAPNLALELDGRRAALELAPPEVGLGNDRGVGGIPFSLDLIALVPAPRPAHTVWFDDHIQVDHEGESEIVLDEAPGCRVTASYRGREGTGLHGLRFAWNGPRASDFEDRSVGFRYQLASPADALAQSHLSRARAVVAAAATVAMLVGIGVAVRRRRRAAI
jgi:hypothetical protein